MPYRHWEAVETSWKPDDVDLQLKYCLCRHVILPSQLQAVHTCLNAATSEVSLTWRHSFLYFDTPCNEESEGLSVGVTNDSGIFSHHHLFSCQTSTVISGPWNFLFVEYQGFFLRDNVAGVWTWPLPSSRGEVRNTWTYTLGIPICFHSVLFQILLSTDEIMKAILHILHR
jgi:hypothetical protein